MTDRERLKRHQSIRLRRLRMASTSYVLTAAIGFVAALTGVLAWRYLGQYVVVVLAINLLLYAIFRSGLNLRFANPNLTVVQMTVSIPPGLYLMFHISSAQGRAALLLVAVVPLLYGILDLSRRRLMTVALGYLLAYGVALVWIIYEHPDRFYAPGEWLLLLALAASLVQLGMVGGYLSHLRHTLREKNRALHEAMARISDMAIRDELTGTFNRRHLLQVLQTEVDRSKRGASLFSACMVDIDHFKRINDTHGHLTGDKVLRACARCIADNVRDIDTFGRYGGEEFLLIMPMTDLDGAMIATNRLRQRIEALEFTNEKDEVFRVTISMGITECTRDNTQSSNPVLSRADEALYRAKDNGRNRVCTTEAAAERIRRTG